jgi:hypothetical protein
MKRSSYAILGAVATVVAATFLFEAPGRARKDPPLQEKERQAETGGASASLLSSSKALRLTPAAQARVGIRAAVLPAVSARRRITAPAVVLSAQSIAASRKAYFTAEARLEKARVHLGVTQEEYARVRKLYQDNRNVSEKTYQAAQGDVRSDRVDVRAARTELRLQEGLVRQKWGRVVAKWVESPTPALDDVLQENAFLVQVSLPPGESYPPPSGVWLAVPGGRQRHARYISPLPQVDPRVQGVSLLYLARAWRELAPGVTLVAGLPIGRRLRGVVLPASAVVWSEGEAWVYVQAAPDRFVRHALTSDFPYDGGFFVSRGLSPGDRVVVNGAQTLLSDELSPKGSAPPEDDDD